jgi:hypothetical protein
MDDRDGGLEQRWAPGWAAVSTSMAQWRREHPRATLTEIELALDERLGSLRTRMLEDTALASEAARFASTPSAERPTCPGCGKALESRGEHERRLMTSGGRDIRLRRGYGVCPGCGLGLFPPR